MEPVVYMSVQFDTKVFASIGQHRLVLTKYMGLVYTWSIHQSILGLVQIDCTGRMDMFLISWL